MAIRLPVVASNLALCSGVFAKLPAIQTVARGASQTSILRVLPSRSRNQDFCCFAPLPYAMRDTSQRPDRCAVVPLMGSRAVGSTVRL